MFDTIGVNHGTDIKFTEGSDKICLAGGKAYLATFEAALETLDNTAQSLLGMLLNGESIGGSGVSLITNRAHGQTGGTSVTSSAIFVTPMCMESVLSVTFGRTDPTKAIGPVINILSIE